MRIKGEGEGGPIIGAGERWQGSRQWGLNRVGMW